MRPDELVSLLIPHTDVRTVDVERVALWAEVGEERLDPVQLLSPRF